MQRGAGGGDGFSHPGHLVTAEVIQDHLVSRLQCGAQELPDPSEKQFSVHRTVGHHRSGEAVVAQAGDEGGGVPMPLRGRPEASLTSRGAAIAPRQVGGRPRFIQKYELSQIQNGLPLDPGAPRRLHVLALLLAGVQRFF